MQFVVEARIKRQLSKGFRCWSAAPFMGGGIQRMPPTGEAADHFAGPSPRRANPFSMSSLSYFYTSIHRRSLPFFHLLDPGNVYSRVNCVFISRLGLFNK